MTLSLQSSLFDEVSELAHPSQPRAGLHHRAASKSELSSALALTPKSGTRRMQVLRAIVNAGNHGLTRHEAAERSGITLQGVCGRVAELKEAGFIVESETRQRAKRSVLYATTRGIRAVSS